MNMNDNPHGGTFCLGKAGLAIGSTATGISTAAAIDYAIDGILYQKAITATAAITAADEQAADTECLYLVQLDSSGIISTIKGTEVSSADMASDVAALKWPEPEDGKCPIGAFKMTTDGVTFTAGTTALDATGCTATYYDLFAVPANPLIS